MNSSTSKKQITGYAPSWQGDVAGLIAFICAPVFIFMIPFEYFYLVLIGTVVMIIAGKAVYGHRLKFNQSLRQVEVVPAWFYFFKSHAVRRYDFTQIRYAALRHGADGTDLVEVAFCDRKTYGLFPRDTRKYYDSLCRITGCEKMKLGQWEKVVDR